MAADLKGKMLDEKTVEGNMVKIDAQGMDVKVGTGMVTMADIAADNGVIHAIDTVQIPK